MRVQVGSFHFGILPPPFVFMKKALFLFVAVFALATSAWSQSDYTLGQITVSFPNTPQIGASGVPAKPSTPQTWVEVEVGFASAVDFTDELTFKYYIYLADAKKCLSGTVTHTNIPKGPRLFSVMYVDPWALARLSGGRFNRNVQEVTVQILNKGQVVAQKSVKNTQGEWWTQCEQAPGMVLNKNQTPFSSLYWDRYVEIKTTAN